MKILMVNKFLYPNGGSETYVFKLGQELEKRGNKVEYFGMENSRRIVGNSVDVYTSQMDFHANSIKKLLYPLKIIYSIEAKRKIRKVIETFQPDIVHLNNFNFQLTPSIIYEIKRHKLPIVYTAHDSQLVCPNHLMQQFYTGEKCQKCIKEGVFCCWRYKCIHGSKLKSLIGSCEAKLYRTMKTYRKIDTIICPSGFIKTILDTNPDLAGRTIKLQNFVDAERREKAESKVSEKEYSNYVLYLGRYSVEKGVRTLLEVCKRTPQITYVFAGDGPLREEVRKVKNVTDLGFLNGERLSEVIRKARYTVFPSECYENCPFSIMESITYGVPVIASRTGGVPELIDEGKSGQLFEPGNMQELEEQIADFWNNNEVVNDMKKNCLQKKFFSLGEYAEQVERVYQRNVSKS